MESIKLSGLEVKPLVCEECGNHYMTPLCVFAADGSGPMAFEAPLSCAGCNSMYLTTELATALGLPLRKPEAAYQRMSNRTNLTVLRMIQPKPGMLGD